MKFDEIHYWSEVKLDIIKDYASAYSQIMSAQRNPTLHHVYIDAFAGAGRHLSKVDNETVARGFGRRLQEFAGFRHVADPLPMRNSNGAVVYYLYFASQKLVAGHIIEDLFNKYRGRNRR